MNSITHSHTPYLTELSGFESAHPIAAVSAAAHATLRAVYPQQAARFDALLDQALATVPDGLAESRGIQLGSAVAQASSMLGPRPGSFPWEQGCVEVRETNFPNCNPANNLLSEKFVSLT